MRWEGNAAPEQLKRRTLSSTAPGSLADLLEQQQVIERLLTLTASVGTR